jgi:hypothetical protein
MSIFEKIDIANELAQLGWLILSAEYNLSGCTAVALKLLVAPSALRRKAAQVSWLMRQKLDASVLALRFNVQNFKVCKFLAGRILGIPLIVLQYYKPSFFYIYIYKEDHNL